MTIIKLGAIAYPWGWNTQLCLRPLSNKKLTKLVATRPSQEDSPHFPTTPSPFPPVPPVPPEKVFLALLTHRPAIYRDPWANHLEGFLISFHCIAFYFTSCHVVSSHFIYLFLFFPTPALPPP